MTPPRSIVFARTAEADLYEIFSYIAENSSIKTAREYRARLDTSLRILLTFPEAGTPLRRGLRRLGFERRMTVLYRVFRDDVQVVRVLYGGRDSPLNIVR